MRTKRRALTFRKQKKKGFFIFYGICVFALIVTVFVMIGTNDGVNSEGVDEVTTGTAISIK